ncbi:S8 family serine peptidase [Chiayiivirga flava]|uniref:Subtilisin family serine protease n=1 Tax=Chiayiivirga flava TaxID=659595 RepID=A0A7W8D7C4_9GAMM|nr:S8 family serine peptidase [Chiayiivirga flava]MBB5208067.1 subtilisin family serine protease [Chiayiivirga flava]
MSVSRLLALPLALSTVFLPAVATAQSLPAPALPDAAQRDDTWAVRLRPGADPAAAAAAAGAVNLGPIAKLPDTYLFLVAGGGAQRAAIDHRLARAADILWQEHQVPRQRYPRLPTDPLFPNQWHLIRGALASVDANVQPAWDAGVVGNGVVIAVADTGVAHAHPDLAPNYRADLSFDFNGNDPDPNDSHGHGTSAAGVAAAADDGGSCGVGAAYRAQIAGLRLIDGFVSDATEAQALAWMVDDVAISSNSWGPSDNGATVEGPGPLTRAAMEQSAAEGRDGRGTIYVWAAGNGGTTDDVGADGYASMRQVIAVAGVTSEGGTPWYGEHGAALLVAAPTNGGSRGITTTNLGGGCTNSFGGTSSAAPLAAGIVALMLDARPELTWRDVQQVLALTAVKVNPGHAGWFDNGAGLHFNEFYGYGMIDAGAAVELATTWELLAPAIESVSPVHTPAIAIPNAAAGGGATDSITVDSDIDAVEHVEVIFSAAHQRRGQMEVTLVSPSGTEIRLLRRRSPDNSGTAFSNWKFGANAFRGEDPNGDWTLRVRDAVNDGFSGTWQNWQLIVHGTGPIGPQPDAAITTPAPFADTPVSGQSDAQDVVLTSTGDAPLSLDTDATLDDATHFAIEASTCTAGGSLEPAATCTVTVRFAPQSPGPHATVLRIATDAGEFSVPLGGTGVVASGAWSGDADFGTVGIGHAGPLREFTLASVGGAPLQLAGAPSMNNPAHFIVEAGTCVDGMDLGTSGTCTVGVRFAPTATGTQTAVLRVPTNAGLVTLALSGEGVDIGGSWSGNAAFGELLVGSTSATATLVLTGDGATPLTLTTDAVLDDTAQFAVTANGCLAGTVLESGESCSVELAFAPQSAGAFATLLRVSSNAGELTAPVSGSGIVPIAIFGDHFEAAD